ncbi:MAG: DUF3078 domain-containing protein [Candidatus Neomarinimicrobiota bacterium]
MMRTNILLATIIILAGLTAQPAATAWDKQLAGNLNLTQNSFDNWTGGGEDAWSWQVDVNGSARYENENLKMNNSGKFSYGKTRVGDYSARKSADEIRLESVLSLKKGVAVNPYVAVTGLTQYSAGYSYPGDTARIEVSNFFDPAYFTQSIGIGFAPNEMLSTRMGASLKETITSDHPVPYADDPETAAPENFKFEFGAEVVTDYRRNFSENLQLLSKLELFSNLRAVDQVDVNWDTTITAKVAKSVSTNFNFRLFYDSDVSPRRQLKQTLALGISYIII